MSPSGYSLLLRHTSYVDATACVHGPQRVTWAHCVCLELSAPSYAVETLEELCGRALGMEAAENVEYPACSPVPVSCSRVRVYVCASACVCVFVHALRLASVPCCLQSHVYHPGYCIRSVAKFPAACLLRVKLSDASANTVSVPVVIRAADLTIVGEQCDPDRLYTDRLYTQ